MKLGYLSFRTLSCTGAAWNSYVGYGGKSEYNMVLLSNYYEEVETNYVAGDILIDSRSSFYMESRYLRKGRQLPGD